MPVPVRRLGRENRDTWDRYFFHATRRALGLTPFAMEDPPPFMTLRTRRPANDERSMSSVDSAVCLLCIPYLTAYLSVLGAVVVDIARLLVWLGHRRLLPASNPRHQSCELPCEAYRELRPSSSGCKRLALPPWFRC